MARQVTFQISGCDEVDFGILFDERWIICECCGNVFDLLEDDVEILEEFDVWMPLCGVE